MNTMQKALKDAESKSIEISDALYRLREQLRVARTAWNADQVVKCDDWHGREETPPVGHIWASDGLSVWLIHSDGHPIPKEAVRVVFWSRAFIPSAPA